MVDGHPSPPASCSAACRPGDLRRLTGGTGLATWASVKGQAADLLGLQLADRT